MMRSPANQNMNKLYNNNVITNLCTKQKCSKKYENMFTNMFMFVCNFNVALVNRTGTG